MRRSLDFQTGASRAQSELDLEIHGHGSGASAGLRGLFVTVEGGEGSGKTTQARLLEDRLMGKGVDVISVREPGTTGLGDYVRAWIKRRRDTTPLAEALLFEAARAQLVSSVIAPALARGSVVICDRFTDSTVAYQGYGRELDKELIRELNDIAADGLRPDLTVLLRMNPGDAVARVRSPELPTGTDGARAVRVDPDSERRFELESLAFHKRVALGYDKLASAEPERWLVVEASQSVEAIGDEIGIRVDAIVKERLRG